MAFGRRRPAAGGPAPLSPPLNPLPMRTVIRNARIVNEDTVTEADLLIAGDRIERIGPGIEAPGANEVDAAGRYLLPGIIDDQVHFREPGLTHKACIATESRAAVAGGTTSFMDMPNVKPPSLTRELLEARYAIAAGDSPANYSFYMGVSNDNVEEVLRTDPRNVCGIKIFMGSSTGNMLVDDESVLGRVFGGAPCLIAVHCEDEARIRARSALYRQRYGEEVPFRCHPEIRDEEACWLSSSKAARLAREKGARLHILHLTTAEELELFEPGPVDGKRITAEACVHHLWFDASAYGEYGSAIKCNPAIKDARHKAAVRQALVDGRIDVIATDHAPHTPEEKAGTYFHAPAGLPMVQHSFHIAVDVAAEEGWELPFLARKMSHAVADCFDIAERGYLREGYFADLFLYDPERPWTVSRDNILHRCGWSPWEGHTFRGTVTDTWVNGTRVWHEGALTGERPGRRLAFAR
jgi:dihydroorotase